jgi:hypothetical protein
MHIARKDGKTSEFTWRGPSRRPEGTDLLSILTGHGMRGLDVQRKESKSRSRIVGGKEVCGRSRVGYRPEGGKRHPQTHYAIAADVQILEVFELADGSR